MRFTELLKHIQQTYPEQPKSFHVIATRYYLGIETLQTIKEMPNWRFPPINRIQSEEIINNR